MAITVRATWRLDRALKGEDQADELLLTDNHSHILAGMSDDEWIVDMTTKGELMIIPFNCEQTTNF